MLSKGAVDALCITNIAKKNFKGHGLNHSLDRAPEIANDP